MAAAVRDGLAEDDSEMGIGTRAKARADRDASATNRRASATDRRASADDREARRAQRDAPPPDR